MKKTIPGVYKGPVFFFSFLQRCMYDSADLISLEKVMVPSRLPYLRLIRKATASTGVNKDGTFI